MIRPITIVTFLMACGSGLYLYQSKHEVQLLDRTIEKSVRDTGALREQSRLLSAEWTMLNDPERLRQFSDTYLSLRTISPAQFTSLDDLDGRLPAPQVERPPPGPIEGPVSGPIGADDVPLVVDEPVPGAVAMDNGLPVPPIPMVRPAPVATPPAHPIEARVALGRPAAVSPVIADQKQPEPRLAEPKAPPRVAEARPEVRPQAAPPPRPIVLAAPRPLPVSSPPGPMAVSVAGPVSAPAPYQRPAAERPAAADRQAESKAAAPYSGSLLGAARGSMPPAPRPLPVNATYNAN